MIDMQRAPKLKTEPVSDIERIEIATAANGFEVTCYEKDKPSTGGKDDIPMAYVPPKRYVFTDAKSMMTFVEKKLSGMNTDAYGDGEDVAEGEAE
jgi:hypothetical protein